MFIYAKSKKSLVRLMAIGISVIMCCTCTGCAGSSDDKSLNLENTNTMVHTVVSQDEIGKNVQFEWPEELDAMPDTWVATDGLNRNIDTNDTTGEVRKDRFVGMFYWTWHSGHAKQSRALDNTKIIRNYKGSIADALNNTKLWGNYGEAHHWSEPLFGHYDTEDEWVLRKHAELLANAGVDYVAMDNTNGRETWMEGALQLLKVWSQAKKDGVRVPQVTFMLPFADGADTKWQLYELYQKIYSLEEYKDMFFYWDDKPLILCSTNCLSEEFEVDNSNGISEQELKDFFTFRYCWPGYGDEDLSENIMQWMSVYPQNISKDSDGNNELIPVSIAQNWSAEKYGLTAMSEKELDVYGRTHTVKNGYDKRKNAKYYGANFEEQFEYAKKIDPEIIFITGWNEWVAGYHAGWEGSLNCFPDQFDQEFSRDIEPESSDMADHYYNQLCDFIRQFKGAREVPKASAATTIDIENSDVSQWSTVGPVFKTYQGNTFNRDADGYLGTHYTNTSGRNDLVSAKVARDADNLYFMVEAKDNITPYTDENWMRLFIDVNNREYAMETPGVVVKNQPNWETYEYVVNRVQPSETKAVLEKSKGGWNWKTAGEVDYKVSGKYLQIKIPKKLLGLDKVADEDLVINFKWADNNLADGKGNIMDFYSDGDVAPGARFKFQYRTTLTSEAK